MSRILLFTDGSVNTQSNVGCGAYVNVYEGALFDAAKLPPIHLKVFEHTSSTKLELQTLLWALEEVKTFGEQIVIYTDSQNIIGLPNRRERFEKNGYITKQKKLHEHALLYQAFYKMMDVLECSLVKVKGHKLSGDKDEIDRYFTLVDRASREGVRKSVYM
ncbi:ribonuclease HI [Sulfurospirillum arsenophilum]|uniref:ribonuclease HI n=1 Tax=Sulfurospirillum arsenophilum TaxID=56698 RepID=UPI0005A73D53|nr:RNase H family protein [Sulfurospirillum arsenophilum]